MCKTNSQDLEIPAANMDFQIELSPREETFFAGNRIYMEVSLTNNGQVPVYGIALQAEAKEMETTPVWEKEPRTGSDAGWSCIGKSHAWGGADAFLLCGLRLSGREEISSWKARARAERPASITAHGQNNN